MRGCRTLWREMLRGGLTQSLRIASDETSVRRRVDCIFCKISEGKSPADFVMNDGDVFAIRDRHPVAPTHILVIPRKHVASLCDLGTAEDGALVSRMVAAAVEVAKKSSLDRGYRLVWNCRAEGGQTVDHIHLHLLGGRQMKWPPG